MGTVRWCNLDFPGQLNSNAPRVPLDGEPAGPPGLPKRGPTRACYQRIRVCRIQGRWGSIKNPKRRSRKVRNSPDARCRSQLLPVACALHTQNREWHHARGTVERLEQRRQPGIMCCSSSGPAFWSEGPRQAQSQRSVHSPPSRLPCAGLSFSPCCLPTLLPQVLRTPIRVD